jgi:hypothetical protein
MPGVPSSYPRPDKGYSDNFLEVSFSVSRQTSEIHVDQTATASSQILSTSSHTTNTATDIITSRKPKPSQNKPSNKQEKSNFAI